MSATPFAARLAAVMVAVVLAASVLTVSLDYLKFRRVLRSQEDLVYLFLANDLASTIEDSMNLGLPLAALSTTQQMIQRRRVAERGAMGISVFDSTGVVLFDTDRFRVGGRMPGEWSPHDPAVAEWRADLPDAYLVGARITNNFGQPAGGVAVRYDPAALDTRLNAILLEMMRAAMVMLAATVVAAIAVAVVLTRPHRAWFARAQAQLSALAPGAPPFRGPAVAGSEAMMQSAQQTSRALDDAEVELMRLGAGETEQRRAA
jgi:sensor histidine kinase regulating citrate/malate metabolism